MKYIVLALSIFLSLVPLARGDEIVLECLQDAELDEEEPDVNKGGGIDIMIGATWGEPELFRAYSLFEFEGIMTIPEYYIVVNAAILTLFIVSNNNDAEVTVFTAGQEWNEMSVTWNTRPAEIRNVVVTDTAPPLEPPVQPWEIDVTEIVQMWCEPNHLEQHGLYIDVPDNGVLVDIDVASKDHPDTMLHPRLWMDFDLVGVSEDEEIHGSTFTVSQVSRGRVVISFSLPNASEAILKVYDASGSLVENLPVNSGKNAIIWTSSAGVYFVRLGMPGKVLTRKVVITN